METKTRLHPLLTVAAVSLTVFSAIGIAALTGVLPHSSGSSEPVVAPERRQVCGGDALGRGLPERFFHEGCDD